MELVVSQCAFTLCPQPAAPLDCCRSDTPNPTLMSGGRPEEIRDKKRETVSGPRVQKAHSENHFGNARACQGASNL